MKGVVTALQGREATLLKNGGEFLTVPARPEWRIGDVVDCPERKPFRLPRALYAAAASVVLLFSLAFGGYAVYFQEAALLSIDVNPSIELSVNRFGRVIGQTAVNEDASALLAQSSLQNMAYADAVDTLLRQVEMQRYLDANGYLLCTVQSANEGLSNAILEALAAITAPLQGGDDVEILPVDEEIVHEAHSHGMTAGKYLLIEELKALDPTIDVEEYGHHGVGEIRAQIRAHGGHGGGNGHAAEEAAEDEETGDEDCHEEESAAPETGEALPAQATPEAGDEHGQAGKGKQNHHGKGHE